MTPKFRALATKSFGMFSGKETTEWEEGYFCKDFNDKSYITTIDGENTWSVDGDSCSRFTGKTFKGIEVFSGHIFGLDKSGSDYYDVIGHVEYDNDVCAFVIHRPNGGFNYFFEFFKEFPSARIIGDIYKNPELLTQQP